MKLHFGCGNRYIPGFVNVDVRPISTVDLVANIKYPHPRQFPPGSTSLIYASHVLEHFGKWEYFPVLQRWFNILKPGGILRLAVPDFDAIVRRYLQTGNLNEIRGPLYGAQDFPENYHLWVWDYESLKADLQAVGFQQVRRWDWRQTEHSHIDDNSQAYIPHMDKENGMLISLNVEGVK